MSLPWHLVLFLGGLHAGCESLEGQRITLPRAHLSLFVPANWESVNTPNAHPGEALLEAWPQGDKRTKLRVIVDGKTQSQLDVLERDTLADVAAMEKRGQLSIKDVTRIPFQRAGRAGVRVVHQLALRQGKGEALTLTQISELSVVDNQGVVLLLLGPKAHIEQVSPEIERILTSVTPLTPAPAIPRVQPPDAVSSASQRVTKTLFTPTATNQIPTPQRD